MSHHFSVWRRRIDGIDHIDEPVARLLFLVNHEGYNRQCAKMIIAKETRSTEEQIEIFANENNCYFVVILVPSLNVIENRPITIYKNSNCIHNVTEKATIRRVESCFLTMIRFGSFNYTFFFSWPCCRCQWKSMPGQIRSLTYTDARTHTRTCTDTVANESRVRISVRWVFFSAVSYEKNAVHWGRSLPEKPDRIK